MSIDWRDGLDALKSQHRKMRDEECRKKIIRSADIDEQFQKAHPQAARWDYLLEIQDGKKVRVIALEVHTASDSEVKSLKNKKTWTKEHLRSNTEVEVARWAWAASGRVSIQRTTKYARQLATAGIEFPQRLVRC